MITSDDIEAALCADLGVLDANAEVDVPDTLLPLEALSELMAERRPRFVHVDGAALPPDGTRRTSGSASEANQLDVLPPPDAATGIYQRRLDNGIRVNYRVTRNEPSAAVMRLVAVGGRAREPFLPGPAGAGAVAVGARTLSESGTVAGWDREQVELFCVSRLISCVLEADEEFLCMDFHFAVGSGGLRAAFELLHLILQAPRWEEAAFERAKQLYLSHYRALPKSLERATAARLTAALLGPDRRFSDPSPEEMAALTLEGVRGAITAQLLAGGGLELCVAGDFNPSELDECLLKYIGTVKLGSAAVAAATQGVLPPLDVPEVEVALMPLPASHPLRAQRLYLRDSDERACAYLAGRAPYRWGPLTPAHVAPPSPEPKLVNPFGQPSSVAAAATAARRSHPLFPSVALSLLAESLNSRLFTHVRDTLGLTYDVSFDLSLFDRLRAGWFMVAVTSTPQKIDEALAASLATLRAFASSRLSDRDLERARRTLLTRHESDLKDDVYWLGLLTHLQASGALAPSSTSLSRSTCSR